MFRDKSGFTKVWVLETTWTDCPDDVKRQVGELWSNYELGNDNYILKTSLNDLRALATDEDEYATPLPTDAIVRYILEKQPDIAPDDRIFLHSWW